jgi:hypothetical protein
MRFRSAFVMCLVSAGIGAGIDHYWDNLVPMVRARIAALQGAAPAAEEQKKEVEVLGDRVKCDVRFAELHLADEEYRAFFDRCMGQERSAEAK